ncbi:seminal metalloprotease 1-like [Toxorhynchites rutilus septentrionalis]|uniref:seminal metalloprotease 1-like n=1 Tax=Toxorhynchites rutilus septentrionalis TaxID=329112 RepID=UPI00247AE706|nr:seminal metalloprotease 1-like [Toxorhynchites rutilus septentrionalis]
MFTLLIILVVVSTSCNGAPSLRIFENSPENVARLQNLQPGDLAEELSGQFEGDMILTDEQYLELFRRNGMIANKYRWPENTVYYEIEEEYFTEGQINYILTAMRTIERASCVRFRPRDPNNPDYIRVHGDGSGCSATVGHIGGSQSIKLQPYELDQGCFRMGSIIHEFIHALGFRHMQSTYNRDEYVQIEWENIQPGTEHNFLLYEADKVSNFGTEYDYGSIMHYSSTAFSINKQKTIVPLKPTKETMGQRVAMSEKDIFKINRMYNCFLKGATT